MSSIRRRLLLLLLVGLGAVLTAGGTALYAVARGGMLRQFDTRLQAQARAIAGHVTREGVALKFDTDDADATIGAARFELRDSANAVLKRFRSLGDVVLPLAPPGDLAVSFADVDLGDGVSGRAAFLRFRPRVEDDEDDPHEDDGDDEDDLASTVSPEQLLVCTAMDRGPLDRALGTLLGALGAVGGLTALIAVGLVLVGVRWGLRPLDRLTDRLGHVTAATISERLDDRGAPAELAPVYRELNRMLDRVERTIERERSFADAAAHELRTPLAELRATAEVALRWPDAERTTAALRELLAIGGEMEQLVEALLAISRGTATDDDAEAAAPVEISEVLAACIRRANGAIDGRGLALHVAVDGGRAPRAPRAVAELILRNLVDNAVRYTQEDGSISIRNDPGSNGSATLIVENGPVSLAAADLPRLFEPFWQGDGARADRAHVGLGLTVVDRVARATGLRVDARLAGDRLQMRITGA